MYAALTLAYLGGALVAGSWWPLGTLPGALILVRYLVIGPEERYLAGHFGQAYLDYQARVRRWL
jgi:protein-S-isoprenylcysteine O-methyltransferase Ste14